MYTDIHAVDGEGLSTIRYAMTSLAHQNFLRLTKNRGKKGCTACNPAKIGRVGVAVSITPFHWSKRENKRSPGEKEEEDVTTEKTKNEKNKS